MMKKLMMIALCVAVLSGCKTGMFAPRSGQLFQTTRMCPGPGSLVYTAPLMMGVWGVQKRGGEWTIPIGIVGIPIAATGFVVDECVVSPLVDLVCLPYDLCQPKRSFYIRVVDEFGQPVPGAKVRGSVKKADYYWLPGEDFSETTDAAGEILLDGTFHLEGYCWVSCPDYASWWQHKNFKTAEVMPDYDGRIVIQFVLPKANPGGWTAKKDISREEVLKLLPGKWSADHQSRVWLRHGFGCRYANDLDRHCLMLDASGKVDSHAPSGYRYYFGDIDTSSSWNAGRYSAWRLQGKDDVDEAKEAHRNCERFPPGWVWRIHLSEGPKNTTSSDNYYLGEDEKGMYLSPGPFSERDNLRKLSLKYRKVVE